NKPAPPPVAPKPDIVISSVPQSTKKAKPAIAPKPKVLKSSVRDVGQSPSRKITSNLEEHKQELPENTDNFNCKNIGDQNSDCTLPTCSCGSECIHKLGNRENLYVKQLVLEPLEMNENLVNNKIDESLTIKTMSKYDSHGEKVKNQTKVVLKASILEEKLKDVLTHRTSPFISSKKHRSADNPEMNGGCNSNRQFRIQFADLSPSLSSFENVRDHHSCHLQLPSDEFQNFEICQGSSEKSNNYFHSSKLEALENSKRGTFMSSDEVSGKSEVKDLGPLEIHLVPYTPKFPTPKPRKTRTARLLRQKYIDNPSESTEDPENSNSSSSCLIEDSLKNNEISVLHQNVLCNQEQVDKMNPGNKSELNMDSNSDRQDLVSSHKALGHETSSFEKMTPSLDTDSNLISDSTTIDGSTMSLAPDKGTSFIRCSTLSMSLPKQLKLTCNEHLPTACNLGVSAPQMQKESVIKEESSSRIVPKKPQRHSLPAAGVLKKAASEELVEKSSYPSNEERNSEKGLERNHLQHLCAQNHGVSSFFDMPKQTSEKPVWKLPHPILPFSGNPESLKSITISSNSEPSPALTKPRAKSLSAVDMERCTKPCKDSTKKNSFKKLLNMKLSICFMKSDFQKFWSRSSQLGDTTAGNLSRREQKGIEGDWHGLLVGEGKRSKPIKAYSADNSSLESQKKRKKSRAQASAANGLRTESLDDQMLSRELSPPAPCKSVTSLCAPEYENIRHYEEIPEYENLPFIMAGGKTPELEWHNSSSLEDTDANVYEVEEPYEAPDGQLPLGPRHQHSSSGASQEEQNDLDIGLGDLPSDEEEVINSSDEDDISSESSKGEPDPLEDKQVHFGCLYFCDFRDAVAHASRQLGKPVIEDRILNQILYYLPQLYELNRDLLKELEERMLNWTEQQRIADIFVKKGPYLKMYSTYIKEFDKNIALLDEQCKKNPGFAAVVREFEMSPRCAHLALKHYLLKPVQRIPQYKLLLTGGLSSSLPDALAVVIEVANHANDTMKQGDNFQKLMQIQYSLSGHHEIVQPGRVFLKEGTLMKLSRKVMQPRMFFLFNDALLYTTPVQSGMYKLNNMLSLAGMKVRKPTQEAYQNELKIESVERSFILSARASKILGVPEASPRYQSNTEDSSMSGYLYRSKGNKKPWKHLWFVIKNKVLYTYAASEDVAALESQPLLGFTVTQVKDENSESKVFQLLHKNMLFYVFKADDAHSAQKQGYLEYFQEAGWGGRK
uniref:FYVE, RhoGEF and PH domain containing 6 n=1 Tax=Propithecus coquereli TaxID=379532 RepID=A0A2K6FRZ4_PROCO